MATEQYHNATMPPCPVRTRHAARRHHKLTNLNRSEAKAPRIMPERLGRLPRLIRAWCLAASDRRTRPVHPPPAIRTSGSPPAVISHSSFGSWNDWSDLVSLTPYLLPTPTPALTPASCRLAVMVQSLTPRRIGATARWARGDAWETQDSLRSRLRTYRLYNELCRPLAELHHVSVLGSGTW
jgi:hypothetical protein